MPIYYLLITFLIYLLYYLSQVELTTLPSYDMVLNDLIKKKIELKNIDIWSRDLSSVHNL